MCVKHVKSAKCSFNFNFYFEKKKKKIVVVIVDIAYNHTCILFLSFFLANVHEYAFRMLKSTYKEHVDAKLYKMKHAHMHIQTPDILILQQLK